MNRYVIEDLKLQIKTFFESYIKKLGKTEGIAIDRFVEILFPCVKYRFYNIVEKCIPILARY